MPLSPADPSATSVATVSSGGSAPSSARSGPPNAFMIRVVKCNKMPPRTGLKAIGGDVPNVYIKVSAPPPSNR